MPIELIDTHCHLTSGELYPHARRVVQAAHEANVSRMITVACRADEAETALQLRADEPGVHVACGIHPHEAGRTNEAELARLRDLWRREGVLAAGEMGLDYHYDFSPRDAQQRVFEKQLEMAAATSLPVVIHCREAQADVIRLLDKHGFSGRRVVFHCFSGSAQEAVEIRGHGWRTSFTGLITFKNAAGPQQALVETPLEQLMFETDSPYLSPEPVRKMRPNEPRNVVHTVRFAAMLRGMTFEEMAELSTSSARTFFTLD